MGKPRPEGKSGWPGESEGRAGEGPGRGNLWWLRRGLSSRQAAHLPWVFQNASYAVLGQVGFLTLQNLSALEERAAGSEAAGNCWALKGLLSRNSASNGL